MSLYHSNPISYELFPQLDAIQTGASGCFSTAAAAMNPNQHVYDPSYYYYAGQGPSSASSAAVVASSILDCEEVLFPSPSSSSSYNTHQMCTTSTSYQLMQSSISPCYTSNGESPLSIESDSFTQRQQQQHQQQQQQQQFQQFYVYGSAMDMDIMTPPSEIYDMPVQPSANVFPHLPTATTSIHLGHHRNHSSSSTCSSMSSPASLFSSGSSFNDEHVHHRIGSLFHCEYKGCTKTFTRTYNLKSHRRTHTDEKPFVCDMCPKAFARQHDRNRHAKLHLGLKPFPCSFCDKSFARQDALNRHLKRDKKKNAVRITKHEEISILPPPCLLLKIKQRQKANLKKKKQLQ